MNEKYKESVALVWMKFNDELDLFVKTPMESALQHLGNGIENLNAELTEKLVLISIEQLDRLLEKSSIAIKELDG